MPAVVKNRFHRKPTVESLESLRLLSGASQAVAVIPQMPSIAVRRSIGAEVDLSGEIQGSYHASTNVITGKRYTFFGHGNVSPLQQSDLTGHVRLPGLVIAGNGTTTTTPATDAHGQIFLADPGGTLTLTLTAPSRADADTLPAVFSYKVTNASGKFRGDSATGQVVIVTDPAAAGLSANPSKEHGTFTLVFVPNQPSSTDGG
jgi:hypothetical protein